MSELIDCINNLSAKDIIRAIAKTANGVPFYLQTIGGASFSPADLPNLILWLDAAVGVTVATGVSSWLDQSPQLNHMTQGVGAQQPALVLGDINGLPIVKGDGIDDWLDFTSAIAEDEFSIFAVIRGVGYWMGNDASAVHYITHNNTSDVIRISTTETFAFAADPLGGQLIEFHKEAGSIDSFKNGIASASNPQANATTSNFITLFRRTASYGAGRIAEIIVTSGKLSAENITTTREYLATKYAITLP